ncbi:MAG: dCMP deaminase family protein [Chitinispirillales bacterium]|jgi:dCMP deaminase|nr:dCMP deaminase family protein [Chitinispirillales bacterium]
MTKRNDYISWNEYFMGIALLSAQRSKDPNTQVGACIVNPQNRIVGVGYNGFPRGCSDDEFPWGRDGNTLDTKYVFVAHAELNAVLNSTEKLTGCKIFATLFPCNECAKIIIQSGINEVIYLNDKYGETDSIRASKRMFDASNVKYALLKPDRKLITVDFE